MRIAFILDPLERLQVHHDTSVALMEGLQLRGHELYTLEMKDLRVHLGETWAALHRIRLEIYHSPWYQILETVTRPLSDLDAVWMRKDPPVDAAYITATQLLDLIPPGTLVLNHPAGLRSANEKLFALQFAQWTPRTLVSQDKQTILEFLNQEQQAVLKPLGGKGGEGILFLQKGDRNVNSLIEISTQFGQVPVMVQEYLPAATEGDKRILLLHGEPLGAVNRIPGRGDFRGNIAAGGSVERSGITERERELCADLAPVLRREKLYFVGLDVIGERLTEVNVTSPTMLREMSQLNQVDLAAKVVQWLEQEIQ